MCKYMQKVTGLSCLCVAYHKVMLDGMVLPSDAYPHTQVYTHISPCNVNSLGTMLSDAYMVYHSNVRVVV